MRLFGCITIYRKLVNLLLIAGTAISCGIEERSFLTGEKLPQKINPRLRPYVQEFERDMGIRVDSSVIIGNSGTLAVCIKQKGKRDQVIVNAEEINLLSDIVLKAVIYHELAHTEYNMEHTSAYDYTLTDPFIYTSESGYYKDNWSRLVDDLKSKVHK